MRIRRLVVISALLLTLGAMPADPATAAQPARLWLASSVSGLNQPTLVANSGDDRGRLLSLNCRAWSAS